MSSRTPFAASLIVPLCLGLACCTFPVRTGYDRNIGDYKPASEQTAQAAPSETSPEPAAAPTAKKDSAQHRTSAQKVKQAASHKEAAKAAQKPEPKGSLEKYASGWLGAKYV